MSAESEEAYAVKVSLGPTINALLKSVCEDLPDTLQPYLLDKLIKTYPAAAKDVASSLDAEATAWKPCDIKMSSKTQLLAYLDDMKWSPTIGAISEQVVYRRPKNAQAFMIEMLAKGDLSADMEPAADEDGAAAKMQALQRGRKARREMAEKKAAAEAKELAEQNEAAAKMQAVRRGQEDRKKAKEKQLEKELERKEQEAAATKMQALQRGKNARKAKGDKATPTGAEPAEEAATEAAAEGGMDAEQEAAAAKMQAMQRGKNARKEKAAQADAATKVQAIQRGKSSRKGHADIGK